MNLLWRKARSHLFLVYLIGVNVRLEKYGQQCDCISKGLFVHERVVKRLGYIIAGVKQG